MKTWSVSPLGPNKIGIQCPYADCQGKAVVQKSKWLRLKEAFVGRACTYCYKTSRIPDDLLPMHKRADL